MSISCVPSRMPSRAGAAATPSPTATVGFGVCRKLGPAVSGSRISAPSPRPKAFLGIGNNLLAELRVGLGPLAMYIVENDRLTETRCFCQPHVSRNNGLEDLSSKETAQVRRYLARERRALIEHRQENTLDLQARIQRSSNAHQGV